MITFWLNYSYKWFFESDFTIKEETCITVSEVPCVFLTVFIPKKTCFGVHGHHSWTYSPPIHYALACPGFGYPPNSKQCPCLILIQKEGGGSDVHVQLIPQCAQPSPVLSGTSVQSMTLQTIIMNHHYYNNLGISMHYHGHTSYQFAAIIIWFLPNCFNCCHICLWFGYWNHWITEQITNNSPQITSTNNLYQ